MINSNPEAVFPVNVPLLLLTGRANLQAIPIKSYMLMGHIKEWENRGSREDNQPRFMSPSIILM